jgi:hypothetical protein
MVPFSTIRRTTVLLLLQSAALGVGAQDRALDLDPAAARSFDQCGSIVLVHCEGTLPRPPANDAFSDTVTRSHRILRARRAMAFRDGETALGAVVITGERIPNPDHRRWQQFGSAVRDAAIPNCWSLGQLGLLAIPLVPAAALAGDCR